MAMGNIECILDEVNNLSDSDLKILVNKIMDRLKLNGGDIKAVQGDSGHAQAQMVTDQYSHILDDDRMHNADLFEQAFYEGKGAETVREASEEPATAGQAEAKTSAEGLDPEMLAKILANPEMAALLTTLARNLK
jgi:hypothetical protein